MDIHCRPLIFIGIQQSHLCNVIVVYDVLIHIHVHLENGLLQVNVVSMPVYSVLSALQFHQDEVIKVMPSMSFSEMIKILEYFLSFLDFAVSFNSPLLLTAVRSRLVLQSEITTLHGVYTSVCCWSSMQCVEIWSHYTTSYFSL